MASTEQAQDPTTPANEDAAPTTSSEHQKADEEPPTGSTSGSEPEDRFFMRELRSPPRPYVQLHPSYYNLLGVPQNADKSTIDRAFNLKLTARSHEIVAHHPGRRVSARAILDDPQTNQLYRAVHHLRDLERREWYDRDLAGGRIEYARDLPPLQRQQHQRRAAPHTTKLLDSWSAERDGRSWEVPRRRSRSPAYARRRRDQD